MYLIKTLFVDFSPLQKMDKNKDGVVTMEEFIIACQEVWIPFICAEQGRINKSFLWFHPLRERFRHTEQQLCSADSLIHFSIFFLTRMKIWWDPCSCLKMWCRTNGTEGDKKHEAKIAEGLVWVCVHGCICAVHPVTPPLNVLSSGSNQNLLQWH